MIYNPHPPYEILQTKLLDFRTLQKLRRFSRYWDLVGNSGNFVETTPLIWSGQVSPFWSFMRWGEWLYARTGRTESIALVRLMELLFEFLTTESKLAPEIVAATLWRDYQRGGRHDKPAFLKQHLPTDVQTPSSRRLSPAVPKRQARHLV
jgi:hypothetical protein